MVLLFEGTPQQYFIDGYTYNNLSFAKSKIKDDWDFLYVVDGGERKGKSVLAQQLAKFVDPSFCLDRIVFTPGQFKRAILSASKGQAVVYDEAYGGINSRQTMSIVNKSIVKMMTEMGSRNLFVFIVLPSFFDLDRYVALWRAKALFHVYVDNELKRGHYMVYGEEKKKDLYVYGKKFLNYNAVKSDYYANFSGKWVVDKEAYEVKKRQAQEIRDSEDGLTEDQFKEMLYKRLQEPEYDFLSDMDKVRILKCPQSFYSMRKTRAKEKAEPLEDDEAEE